LAVKALGKGSVASVVEVALTIAWWLLWIGLGLLVIAAFTYAGLYALIGAGVVDANILTGGTGHIQGGSGGFHVSYDNPGGATWPVVVPSLLVGGVVLGGGLIIVGRLRKLFASFTSGEPFRRENATHLRVIWITMLLIEIARFLLLGLVGAIFAAVGLPEGADANVNIHIDVSTWMSIAILIVLAEVFREGARMKEEQELTI
jgi:Protein of unknown function (DUF2975)